MSKTLRRRSTDKGRRTKGKRTMRKVTNKSKSRLRTKHRTKNNRLKKNNRLRGNHSFKTYNGGVGLMGDAVNYAADRAFPYRRGDQEFNQRYPHLNSKLETAKKVGNVVRHPRRKLNEYRDSLREQRQDNLNALRDHANINRNQIIHNREAAGLPYLNRRV